MAIPQIQISSFNQPHCSESDKANAAAVLEFVQLLMNEHNFDAIRQRYKRSAYKQHNRNMGDGIEGVLTALADLVKNAPEFSYEVKRVFVDGDHVIIHSHATLKASHRGNQKQGMNIMDTWKVEQGKLVEHWDAVQGLSFSMRLYGLMVGGKVRNGNGVF